MRKGVTKDLSGKRFGALLVIKQSEYVKVGKEQKNIAQFLCKCICGKDKVVKARDLKSGHVKSCGCSRIKGVDYYEDLTGLKFSRLLVVERGEIKQVGSDGKNPYRTMTWKCLCDCGNIGYINTRSLKTGNTRSCGCLIKDGHKAGGKKLSLPKGVAAWNSYLGTYKYHAKCKNIEFLLSKEKFIDICSGNCVYCGLEPSRIYPPQNTKHRPNGDIVVNGVDRVDSNGNYDEGNCVSCCSICNQAKNNMPYQTWKEWVQRLIDYNKDNLFDINSLTERAD